MWTWNTTRSSSVIIGSSSSMTSTATSQETQVYSATVTSTIPGNTKTVTSAATMGATTSSGATSSSTCQYISDQEEHVNFTFGATTTYSAAATDNANRGTAGQLGPFAATYYYTSIQTGSAAPFSTVFGETVYSTEIIAVKTAYWSYSAGSVVTWALGTSAYGVNATSIAGTTQVVSGGSFQVITMSSLVEHGTSPPYVTTGTASTTFSTNAETISNISTVANFPEDSTFSYDTTVETTNTTTSSWDTTSTVTSQSTFMSSTSSSYSTTTTGLPSTTTESTVATTTSSSANTFTTYSTATAVIQTTTGLTSGTRIDCIVDTVYQAETTDWLWTVTNTSTDQPSAIGTTFTKATQSGATVGGTVYVATPLVDDITGSYSTFTYTSVGFSDTTATLTTTTSASSTYNIAIGGGATPLTNTTSTATVNYTTTSTTTFEYTSTFSDTGSNATYTAAIWTTSQSSSYNVPSTNASGTETVLVTFTIPIPVSMVPGGSLFSSQTTSSYNAGQSLSSWQTIVDSYVSQFTVSSATWDGLYAMTLGTTGDFPTYYDTTIGQGWESPGSLGAGEPIGTNITGIGNAGETALGWPGLSMAVPASTDTPGLQGSVPATLQTQIYASDGGQMGGFDWNSTSTTSATFQPGIYRLTTCDSYTNTATTLRTYSPTSSTRAVAPGQGLAMETVPQAASSTIDYQAGYPFLQFSAFPVTT